MAENSQQAWIIEMGEDHEGGWILGVYAERDLAAGEFVKQAGDLNGRFGGMSIDQAAQGEDGSLYLHAGCDWLRLTPYQVITARQLEG